MPDSSWTIKLIKPSGEEVVKTAPRFLLLVDEEGGTDLFTNLGAADMILLAEQLKFTLLSQSR